jgi:histidinol-phosphate/aromatic aminotransferase/cobyric acid decarboxylase-like protein
VPVTIGPVPAPGPHGGDAVALARWLAVDPADVLDLSASLNPVAPDPAPVVGRHLDALARYPDPTSATGALAEAIGVDPGRLLLTNGGAEAIALVGAELGAGWADACDFSLYRRHLTGLDPGGVRWRSDPHSPLGGLAGPGVEADVWDEAFYPLATGRWTAGRHDSAGAVTIGSLTKLLACPGLRAGYVITPAADPGLRARLAARQPRWSVNGLVASALPELLASVDLALWAGRVAGLRADLCSLLRGHGFEARPAAANWVLVPASPGLRARLAHRGVLVRDCASFGLTDTHRIAVPGAAGLERLEEALCGVA